jgi:hypothetical protein
VRGAIASAIIPRMHRAWISKLAHLAIAAALAACNDSPDRRPDGGAVVDAAPARDAADGVSSDASSDGRVGTDGGDDGGDGAPSLTCDRTLSSLADTTVAAELESITAGGTATDPYVVCLPAGAASWTTQVRWVVPPNVALRGAGSQSVLGGGDATIITDDLASTRPLLAIETSAAGSFRLTGITLRGGTGQPKENGLLQISGATTEMRIDHIHIDMRSYVPRNSGKPIALYVPQGVVDHSIFDHAGQGFIHFLNGGDEGGDEPWAAPTAFGGANFIFLEDNLHHGDEDPGRPGHYQGAVSDCHTGGRFVIRYSTIVSLGVGQTHPTGHGAGHDRGCRAHELYGNHVMPAPSFDPRTDEPPFTFDYTTSGTALLWGNTAEGVYKNIFYLNVTRRNDETYRQDPTPEGWGYCGTQFDGTGSAWDGNTDPVTGYPCIDQPGRGQGDLLTGDFPTEINSRTGTIAWPSQRLEPIYEWSNTASVVPGWGGSWLSNRAPDRLVADRDFYLHEGSTSCDGGAATCAGGVGSGARAQRPPGCTPGVAWWSTDAGGDWNRIDATANDGTLDLCTAPDTWTDGHYTPYAYPHPLVR